MGYTTERRRKYRVKEVETNGLYELNRKQELCRAKRKGYVSENCLVKYGLLMNYHSKISLRSPTAKSKKMQKLNIMKQSVIVLI